MKTTWKKWVACVIFAALIALGAYLKVEIPMKLYTMHFTLQWLFVLGAAFLLGKKWGTISVLLYLAIGLIGAPVFAAGGGPKYVLRPGFGFLLGFLVAVIVMGTLCEKRHFELGYQFFLASLVGMFFYYGIGSVYFYLIKNFVSGEAVSYGVVFAEYCAVTIMPDIVLCVVAAAISYQFKPSFDKVFFPERIEKK